MTRTVILRSSQVFLDLLVLSLALWLAAALRFEGAIPPHMVTRLLVLWPYVVALQYGLLFAMGIPRFAWRYVGLREAIRILAALGAASLMLALIRAVTVEAFRSEFEIHLPYGVIVIDLVLAFLGVGGARVIRRISSEQAEVRRLRSGAGQQVRTLLVGAGRAGVIIAKEIAGRPELGVVPVGFVDDDPHKHGMVIHGLKVLGSMRDVSRIARDLRVKQAIITVSNAPGSTVRSISEVCKRAGLQVKLIPGLYRLVGGEINLSRIRDVAIEDLLRRDAVVLDDEAITKDLRGGIVVVSGAGGSIGSEVCRQVCRYAPKLLVLIEQSENALFEIHRELRDTFPGQAVEPCLADITQAARIDDIFTRVSPTVVFHAAAYKHVPMLQWNPGEGIKNNVLGTRTLADAADAHGVRAFVMISTDKAVNPSSVMGATKRVAELYIQALSEVSNTRFVAVRFGNVLGSNGSVVPIFKEQIARGGPITVTHPDMKRYFMTIPEACQLVLEAGAMGRGGEIFILDMGEPVKIVDLARDLIQLSGFSHEEIKITFSGVRPGEKLYEELSMDSEQADKTRHPKIFIGRIQSEPIDHVRSSITHLLTVAERDQLHEIKAALRQVVPEYQEPPPSDPPPSLDKVEESQDSIEIPANARLDPAV